MKHTIYFFDGVRIDTGYFSSSTQMLVDELSIRRRRRCDAQKNTLRSNNFSWGGEDGHLGRAADANLIYLKKNVGVRMIRVLVWCRAFNVQQFKSLPSRALSSPTIARKHDDFQLSLPYIRALLGASHSRGWEAQGVCVHGLVWSKKVYPTLERDFFFPSLCRPFGHRLTFSRQSAMRPTEKNL